MRRTLLAIALVTALVAASCGGGSSSGGGGQASSTTAPIVGPGTTAAVTVPATTAGTPGEPLAGLEAETVARALRTPVFLTAPAGDSDLYVLEKAGRIVRIGPGGDESDFLDLTPDVGSSGLEQGLLGMAFHPDYADNGRFFVYYTDLDGTSRLYEYAAPGGEADPGSARLVLSQPQPASNHNAGMLEFGPDGYLYVSLGDGGGANDEFGHGQRSDTLLGTILRLDVDGADPYAVPPDNPFVAGGGAAQVWAYGLRNPWRFTIDPVEELLYIADVGQDEWEEVNATSYDAPGLNYGWPITEGPECLDDDDDDECDRDGLVEPVFAYEHDQGCSITGGFVYRGTAIPELDGHYFYADWCGQWVRSFRLAGGSVTAETDWTAELGDVGQVLSFGRDGFGELYVLNQDGFVLKIVPRR